MHTSMPIGIDDFAKVCASYYFVDKTAFLRDFLKDHAEVTLFTRPRRFGKTLTLSMMRYFLDIEGAEVHRSLFDGLAIAEDSEAMAEQGTRPVLFLTLKGWKGLTWDILQVRVRQQIGGLFSAYDMLLQDDLKAYDRRKFQSVLDDTCDFAALSDALAFLLRLMEAHYGKKPVLLLDEYDVPIQSAWEHGYYDEAIDFFREFYSTALKTNPSLDFAVMTGVLRIAKENIFSALNNLDVDSVLQMRYPEAFGFTTAEVGKMAEDLGCTDKLSELRYWYDGYRFAGREIYNPWSVVQYFSRNCEAAAYWVNTSGNAILEELMKSADREHFEALDTLLQGGTVSAFLEEGVIYSDIGEDQDALYTMLCTTGYLTIDHTDSVAGETEYILRLPNREMRTLFGHEIVKRYQKGFGKSALVALMRALLRGDVERVQYGFESYLEKLASFYDTAKGNEAFYHGFVLGMTAILVPTYDVRSNRESGRGRYDLAAIPQQQSQPGFLLEFKTAASKEELEAKAQEALDQMETKDYLADFRTRGVEDVHRYGIAFCGKKVQVAYQRP
ncbi:MAG: ATP-binding protein [Selenomonas sp.]|uniref:AAA family ATPase n=1 Tax=Selenomonas sp. TaxID=2053611 RepID=UPI0025FB2373|nr:AAA family ATPase [Selenomonas sp.]MCI6232272.1 ATP-binding protein [Selenomonas sp.]